MADPAREEAALKAALAKATPEGIVALLQQANPDLLRQLQEQAASAQLPQQTPTADAPAREQVGAQIGPYRLLQELGEGGMGSVFLAEQQHPVERRVALKIIKAGMDSRQVLARFEAEEQALAMMDHPNIAKVFDAGVTQAGRPYFVMELVKGIPITQYCDQEHLTPRERLELFIPVCQAVQHAHQKGVIHRDLKPSNVIVALYDGKPVPKVIDFGVAKATGAKLTERTMFTEVGQMVGTLEYMAPEQAELNNLDIDTRADIYSLGVLLYELLTGSPPFSGKELRSAAFDEMLRIIREVEPPKPSTKLSSSEELPAIAAKRELDPQRLTKFVAGELDWIVMKCLEKERGRRYETANGLATDIEHYLHDEPVLAGPPSRAYRLRKLVRRNKVAIVTAGVIAASLLMGLCGTTWQAIRATRAESLAQARYEGERTARSQAEAERNRANEQGARADAEAEAARQQEEKARAEAAISQAVRDFLQNKLLGQADTRTQADALLQAGRLAAEAKPNPTIRELLDRAAQELAPDKIEENFPQQHLVQAEILRTVGDTYRRIGAYELAIGPLRRAAELREECLGPDHSDTLFALDSLASAYEAVGRLPEAIQLHDRVQKALAAKLGSDHRETLRALRNLAVAYWAQGNRPEAFQLLEHVRSVHETAFGPDDPDTLITLQNLAIVYQYSGRLSEAIQLFERVQQALTTKLGSDHPDTLRATCDLAAAYQDAKRLPEAIQLYEQVRTAQETKLDRDHPDLLNTLHNLAAAYRDTQRLPEAIQLFERVQQALTTNLGSDHPLTLKTGGNLAGAYRAAGRVPEAIELLDRVQQVLTTKLGPDHPDTLIALGNLAATYHSARQFDKSVPLFEDVLKRMVAKFGRQHPETLMTVANLGVNYKDVGRLSEALPLLEEAYRAGAQYPSLRKFGAPLLDGYVQARKPVESASLVKELLIPLRQSLPADSPRLAGGLALYGFALLRVNAFDDAETLLRECLTIREKADPDAWTTFNTECMLGGALLGQAKQLQGTDAAAATVKFTEAEPLLVQGYEQMMQRADKIPPEGKTRPTEALQRLVDLYTAWGKPDEAAKWQQKLDEAKAAEAKAAEAQAGQAKPEEPKTEEATKVEPAPEEKKE
jgi:eukaryotic-like serine/threonine-protein kinase